MKKCCLPVCILTTTHDVVQCDPLRTSMSIAENEKFFFGITSYVIMLKHHKITLKNFSFSADFFLIVTSSLSHGTSKYM